MSLFSQMESVDHSRGRASPESQAAWQKVRRTLSHRQVEILNIVRHRGAYGATLHEIAMSLGTTPNAISGRLSELRFMGRIYKTGRRRANAAVYTSAE